MQQEDPKTSSVFTRAISSPIWEGVVFPGLDLNNPYALVYEAPISEALKPYIQAIWFMTWDIPEGTEYRGIGVPIPCIKISATNSASFPSNCYMLGPKNKGVMLTFGGKGQGLGVDFRPGGLYPFLGNSLDSWTNHYYPIDEVFTDMPKLPTAPWNLASAEEWLHNIEGYFIKQLEKTHSNHLGEIGKAIQILLSGNTITQVNELLPYLACSKRTLQRMFQVEVGLSIKDVLRVTRFHQAIKALNGAETENLAQFALESGYFDQPHMINEFKKLVEESPKSFKKYW